MTDAVTTTDAWALYSGLRDEVIELARSLSERELGQPVPLTPGWTNAEVVAHVCGLVADVNTGVREGLGTDERTNKQVADRAGHAIGDVCDEWMRNCEALAEVIAAEPVMGLRLSADLVVHLHDMQHGLGVAIDRNSVGSISGGNTDASRTPDRLIEVAGVALTIELTDGQTYKPSVDASSARPLTLRTPSYDFLRSVTGRRSRAEVAGLGWSEDPATLLDVFSPYGPLRSEDAGV